MFTSRMLAYSIFKYLLKCTPAVPAVGYFIEYVHISTASDDRAVLSLNI